MIEHECDEGGEEHELGHPDVLHLGNRQVDAD